MYGIVLLRLAIKTSKLKAMLLIMVISAPGKESNECIRDVSTEVKSTDVLECAQ